MRKIIDSVVEIVLAVGCVVFLTIVTVKIVAEKLASGKNMEQKEAKK